MKLLCTYKPVGQDKHEDDPVNAYSPAEQHTAAPAYDAFPI